MLRSITAVCLTACSLLPAGCGSSSVQSDKKPADVTPHAVAQQGKGDTLLITSRRSPSDIQIFRVNPDGSGRKRLTDGMDPALSPDGKRIAALMSFPEGEKDWWLCVMNADSSGQRKRIAEKAEGAPMGPSWSPDGQRIAFHALIYGPGAGRGIGPSGARLYVVDADGGNLKQVGTVMGLNPAWSPDGKQLLFTRWQEGPLSLCVVDLDGKNERELVKGVEHREYAGTFGGASMGAWSPDGQSLAYVIQSEEAAGLYVARADGSKPRRLAGGLNEITLGPQWSADGKRLFFTWMAMGGEVVEKAGRLEKSLPAPSAVHVIDIDGRNLRRVTEGDGMEYLGGAGFFLACLGPVNSSASAPRGMPTTNWGPGPAPLTTEEKAAVQGLNNLKQIGLAVNNYRVVGDIHKIGLPAAICDKDGKPLLSWRVKILPFLKKGGNLGFKLDEPWDSEHNKKLIPLMPEIYRLPAAPTKPGWTHYRVFVGAGLPFESYAKGRNIWFTKSPLLAVEAAESVPWTKPDELVYDPKKPLPKFGNFYGNGTFQAVFWDGHADTLTSTLREETLRALIIGER